MKSTLSFLLAAILIASASAFGVYTPIHVGQRVSKIVKEDGVIGPQKWQEVILFFLSAHDQLLVIVPEFL